MGNSTLIRRATEILVVLFVAVSSIALISGNTRYAGATANLMSSALLCEYNNIKSMISAQGQVEPYSTASDFVNSDSKNDINIDSNVVEDITSGEVESNTIDQFENSTLGEALQSETVHADSISSSTADALSNSEETNAQLSPEFLEESEGFLNEPVNEVLYKYTTGTLNLRKGSSSETDLLGTIAKGERVQCFEVQGEYIKIKTSDNKQGYVFTEYLSDSLPPVYKYVNINSVNIRKGSGSETDLLGTIAKGERVQIFEAQGKYIKIKTSDNIEGYVYAEYLSDSLPPVYRYINADMLNVRKGPSTDAEKLTSLSRGSRVQFLEKHGDWALIKTSDGIKGYSYAKYVVTENVSVSRSTTNYPYNSEQSSTIIEYAKQFLGVPYVYGGSSPKGFDCSGFTQYVYKNFNIKVPRTAKDYAGTGSKVDRSNMKPGDVLLFDRYNDYQLGHVGIYLGGDQFIHASSSKGKVVIGYLSKYGGNILGIRRVIK